MGHGFQGLVFLPAPVGIRPGVVQLLPGPAAGIQHFVALLQAFFSADQPVLLLHGFQTVSQFLLALKISLLPEVMLLHGQGIIRCHCFPGGGAARTVAAAQLGFPFPLPERQYPGGDHCCQSGRRAQRPGDGPAQPKQGTGTGKKDASRAQKPPADGPLPGIPGIRLRLLRRLLRGQPQETLRHPGKLRRQGKILLKCAKFLHLPAQIAQLLLLLFHLFRSRQTGAFPLQVFQPLLRQAITLRSLGNPFLLRLGPGVGQGRRMIAQFLLPGGVLLQPPGAGFLPGLKLRQLGQSGLQVGTLLLGLGQQAGTVVAAPVFQLPQALFQQGSVAAFVPGGDQGV